MHFCCTPKLFVVLLSQLVLRPQLSTRDPVNVVVVIVLHDLTFRVVAVFELLRDGNGVVCGLFPRCIDAPVADDAKGRIVLSSVILILLLPIPRLFSLTILTLRLLLIFELVDCLFLLLRLVKSKVVLCRCSLLWQEAVIV